MLIGRGESIAAGRPWKLHQRIAWASLRACSASIAGVTPAASSARGTLRPSKDSCQKPLMSGGVCAADSCASHEQSRPAEQRAGRAGAGHGFCTGGTIDSRWLGSLESHHASNAQLPGGVRSATIS